MCPPPKVVYQTIFNACGNGVDRRKPYYRPLACNLSDPFSSTASTLCPTSRRLYSPCLAISSTGSVEIERGVGYPLEHQSSRLSSNDPTQGNDLSATATAAAASRDEGNSAADSGNNSVRFNRFGHGSSKDAAGTGDRQHTTRDARWRASDLDDVGSGRSFPSAWASYGSAGAGAGVELPRKGWRTEADADLSDIKATMRRIDGER